MHARPRRAAPRWRAAAAGVRPRPAKHPCVAPAFACHARRAPASACTAPAEAWRARHAAAGHAPTDGARPRRHRVPGRLLVQPGEAGRGRARARGGRPAVAARAGVARARRAGARPPALCGEGGGGRRGQGAAERACAVARRGGRRGLALHIAGLATLPVLVFFAVTASATSGGGCWRRCTATHRSLGVWPGRPGVPGSGMVTTDRSEAVWLLSAVVNLCAVL